MTTLSMLKQLVRRRPIGQTNARQKAAAEPEWMVIVNGPDGTPNAGKGQVFAQRPAGADIDGNARDGEIVPVFAGGRNYFDHVGARISVVLKNGALKIDDIDDVSLAANNYDTKALNLGNPINRWVYPENFVSGKFFPVANNDDTSFLLGMRGLVYIDADGTFRVRQLDRQSSKPSLASYVPAAGLHRLVVVFIRAYDNSIQLFASTAQSIDTALDATDVQECIDQSIVNEDMPNLALVLADEQLSVDMRDVKDDFRQWLNTPQLPGMPNPLDVNWHVRSTRHDLVADSLEVSEVLTVDGVLTVVDTQTVVNATGELTIAEINFDDSPYTLIAGVDVILADTSTGAITVALPAIATSAERAVSIKNVGTNLLTIDANGSETIDGELTQEVSLQYDAPKIVAGSTEWSII
jgi:hypothetical protein